VRDWLLLDGPAAAGLADDLVASGLAETGTATGADGDTIRMTEAARRLRQDVITESAQITGPVLATLDRADLETTIRTLNEITRRVRETFGTEES
jgi:DNA-binding MarR family transcriptional regulator